MKGTPFEARYDGLNPEQKKAVDTIEGPVMVVAGPGSGKTELLGMRVAKILQQPDTSPHEVLCLTFTDAAATNMKDRLTQLVGAPTASKVPINTFHGFGRSVIDQYPTYFFEGARAEPADELARVAIVEEVLAALPHGNPLRSFHPEEGYIYLREVIARMGELKQAGISPEEFRAMLGENKNFIDQAGPKIGSFFEPIKRLDKNHIGEIADLIRDLDETVPLDQDQPRQNRTLQDTIVDSLKEAQARAESDNSTKPLTAWKNKYLEKDFEGRSTLKDSRRMKRHQGLAEVYDLYQKKLAERALFDFDDMLMAVINACEEHPDLLANLQERFQYVLVDEFQDTSGVQSRLLSLLLDAPSNEGRPNILVVGDDDQSIMKFQGANIANIMSFNERYAGPEIVVLTRNYRSSRNILDIARSVIVQGEDRLEVKIKVSKELSAEAEHPREGVVEHHEFPTLDHELVWMAHQIRERIASGQAACEIAVIAPKHAMLEGAAKIFDYFNIPVAYERRRNLLNHPRISEILLIFEYVSTLIQKDRQIADAYMPEILSQSFWEIDEAEIFKISLQANRTRKSWIEVMLEYENDKVQDAARFLLALGREAPTATAEEMIANIIGTNYKEHHFSEAKLKEAPDEYIDTLESLRGLIAAVQERPGMMKVEELIKYVQLHKKHKIALNVATDVATGDDAIQLMTVYKSKGQEFDTVFVLGCTDKNWVKARTGDKLPMPANLPISAQADTDEDKIRVLYVAITRARMDLLLTSHAIDQNSKKQDRAKFLYEYEAEQTKHEAGASDRLEVSRMHEQLLIDRPLSNRAQTVLRERVKDYKLSASALNTFLDVAEEGPRSFMEKSLLRFPLLDSPQAAYGTAVHEALSEVIKAHGESGTLPKLNFLIEQFTAAMNKTRMNRRDLAIYTERGIDTLPIYFEKRGGDFNPNDLSECDFRKQEAEIEGMPVTGKIDKFRIDPDGNATVYDFKTGKPLTDWEPKGRADYEKIKAHKYKRQLIFYKLMVEASKEFGPNGANVRVNRGVLEFVEPDNGEIRTLELEITDTEVERTRKLIRVVSQKIRNLDFPDTGKYPQTYAGILQFEGELLGNR